MGILDRLQHAWNAFIGKDETRVDYSKIDFGYPSYYRPDRMMFSRGNERSIVTAIYNRIAIDCASLKIKHVRVDDKGRYTYTIDSNLNECLTISTNKDQTPRSFFQDVVQSLFDEGCVAIVPVDTEYDITKSSSFDILSMRVAKITQWYSDHVKVEAYNDRTGKKEEIIMAKREVAIIENPLYSVVNERNSTLQRLIDSLNMLDAIDKQTSSGKLDLIIQLPYIVKTEQRKKQAEERRQDITKQLADSEYGIAYTDGTEKITQLNRPVENNLLSKIEYLTSMLYSQLGITTSVLDGTADEKTMLNYMSRTVEPIVSAIVDEMKRKFLTKTARTQGQSIMFFNDPFRLVPVSQIAEMADKFTRNEIMSSNEVRQIIGLQPSDNPKADELINKNITQPSDASKVYEEPEYEYVVDYENTENIKGG